MTIWLKPSMARSGARRSWEAEYTNASSSLLAASSCAVRVSTRASSLSLRLLISCAAATCASTSENVTQKDSGSPSPLLCGRPSSRAQKQPGSASSPVSPPRCRRRSSHVCGLPVCWSFRWCR